MARDKVLRCHTWHFWSELELVWSCGVDCFDEICWINFLWGQYLAWMNAVLAHSISHQKVLNCKSHSLMNSMLFCYSHLIRFDPEEVFPVSKSTPCHDMSLPWTRATVPFGATELRCLQRPTSPGARSAALCTVSLPALPMSCPKSSGSCGKCSRDVRGSVACWKMAEDDEPSPSIGL